jgi:Flp pilus assembly protein TadD
VYYLILNHPHLPAAIKIVSENFSQAVSIYERFKTKDFYEKNIDYALGIACFDVGKLNKAVKHLKKALTLASTEQRIKHINGLLEQAKE